jgi:RNA polymerase sigma-70 factor (ECF subfamily)
MHPTDSLTVWIRMAEPKTRPNFATMDERDLVAFARAGAPDAFRAIMQRANQRLFRAARSLMRDDAEAEDVVQEAYVRGFTHLGEFRGEASIFTWLTRIVINEANGRLRKQRANVGLEAIDAAQSRGAHVIMFPNADVNQNPELDVARLQVRRLLETVIDDLPEDFRLVFIMRDVDGCSIAETASALGVREETIKTRLHRARRLLRTALSDRLASSVSEAFLFMGVRCERMTEAVMARLGQA